MRIFHALLAVGTILSSSCIYAFEVDTHRRMNVAAVDNDLDFDSFLKADVGFSAGCDQQLNGKDVRRWISDGGADEDAGARALEHFHDPLRPWTSAGLGHGFFNSSVIWMQQPHQGWSWQDGRDAFYAALTSPDQKDRDLNWTITFRAVGAVMHLIEDAGQPAHVRNDQHIGAFLSAGRLYGNFESWALRNPDKLPLTGGGGFDHDILNHGTQYSQAPVPVANLIDTDTYDGSFVVFGPSIGIAEFTNANFFSEDTVNLDYPHPDLTRVVPTTWTVAGSGELRQYWAKGEGDGVPVDPVLVGTVLDNYIASPIYSTDDDRVWEATAQYVGPKATDYAQGALDYFSAAGLTSCPIRTTRTATSSRTWVPRT